MAHLPSHDAIIELYQGFATGRVGRRDFMKRATSLGIAGAAAAAIGSLASSPTEAAVQEATKTASAMAPLDLAEWSYFWLGVQRAKLARGTLVNGEQMYVEYFVPAQVRHPFSIVMVHGGGGQGLDWMTTADGRPGWAHLLVQQGYRVYVVDRPGHGRSPYHPDVLPPFGARAGTYETLSRQFTAPEKAAQPYGPVALLHNQWAGATGVAGDPTVDQVAAGQGGGFVPDLGVTHGVWAQRAGELLDKIGPAVIMTHSAGGPFAWLSANARPNLVVGLLPVEPAGPPFGNLRYGVAASPLVFDPPISDASELKTTQVTPTEPNRDPYLIQVEPARKLKNLQGIPIGLTTAPASYHYPYDHATVAVLRQAGCDVTFIELNKIGITGNGHFMMMERNNREVLQPILDFLDKTITPAAQKKIAAARRAPAVRSADSTAMKLADFGNFWVGAKPKDMPYGKIAEAATFVQYLTPVEVRHQTPVVLVHGGSAQMLHYMGNGDGASGWAHYYVQAGYKVYLIDRPGHGRGVYHPDALGPIAPLATYEQLLVEFQRSAKGANKQWPGTGEIGDPLIDQFMASQNGLPVSFAQDPSLGSAHGAELLDKIGPAIVQTHSAAGTWGWMVADARPALVKALVCFEGAGAPLVAQAPPGAAGRQGGAGGRAGGPPAATRTLNLRGIPMLYFTAENSGRTNGPEIVAALKQSGAQAEHVFLQERGLRGNGHMAMLENNRKQVFEFFRGWVEKTV
ncbi:MAG: alpha/beta fold hydrolase [Vicinamibacterales bacterium]